MKLVSVETPEKSVCKMTFSATAEELEAASNAVYERTRASYTIKGFAKGEPVDVVIRPEDVDVVPVEKGMLSGKVFSVTFKGDYYEIIVDVAGFKWMLETSDYVGEGQVIGLRIEPDAIHVMKRSKFSDTFGDYSTFSEEMEHLSDVTGEDEQE